MSRFKIILLLQLALFTLAGVAEAQFRPPSPWIYRPRVVNEDTGFPSASGPRIGISVLSSRMIDTLEERFDKNVAPVISQFGWQFEQQFLSGSGLTGVTEVILLVGGAEQGVLLPSATFMAGLRAKKGYEFAMGPNVSGAGFGLAVAAGKTNAIGELNIPLNVALVTSPYGIRLSLLTGFNL